MTAEGSKNNIILKREKIGKYYFVQFVSAYFTYT